MSDCGSCRVNAFVPATHGRKLHSRIRALEARVKKLQAELEHADWAWKQETDKAEKAEAELAVALKPTVGLCGNEDCFQWFYLVLELGMGCPYCGSADFQRAAGRESGRSG